MKIGKLWKPYLISELINPSRIPASIDSDQKYKQIKVRLNQKGLELRKEIGGNELIGSNQFLAKANQLIISKLDARNGAMGIVPSSLDDAVVTGDFLLYQINEEIVSVPFFNLLMKNRAFVDICKKSSEGTTNRKRLKPDRLLATTMLVPDKETQKSIVLQLDQCVSKIKEIKSIRLEQIKEANQLIYSAFQDAIKAADWIPMDVIAPIIRREVIVTENEDYPELGIRSFGKGTFHKPALSHFEVGSKSLYRIHAGDLLFSNVFAWEGAIAVAKFEDHLRVGSHRFISCVPEPGMALPEFLCYYFLTEDGMEKINAASPGGAGRNKTLGLEKLKKIKVPVPSIEQQEEFVALKHKMDQLKKYYQETVTELEQLFPSLLNKYFTS